MRVHKLTLAALAVAAGLSLTACQSDDDGGSGGAAQSAPSSVPLTSSGASASSGAAGSSSDSGQNSGGSAQGGGTKSGGTDSGSTNSGGADTAGGAGSGGSGKAGKCRTDDLQITASDSTIGGDPKASVTVTLKNSSGHDCVISGYAGVDLKTDSGTVSAERVSQQSSVTAVLGSGKATYFPITYPFNKTGGTGVRITGLVVTPPDETHPVTLNWPGKPSLPVTDGSGSPVEVGPVGSAGQGG
ncbi:DUF4232 domain-containing protein [Streptomyces sp. 8L]|uniref:DUF4232 domain-containing protein n=1 Tax=Streptomyces sp. 8L TaxID=2877242 RepID=UPI001CD40F9C|nr:DUF4232 domain-containing protein [Streptomyces sp. 8L]MCA1218283.1 DUF4232 domain-containing protein [Streptomyces sp. 8L]